MRAVFFGTPAIAVPSLSALAEIAEIVGVVCQPDRPKGRGLEISAPPVKLHAEELGFEVFQPLKVRDGTLLGWLKDKRPDVALVIAYGRILDRAVLSAPRLGCVNLHASLLPRHRGAAPIQHALLAGDTETGVCLMQMDDGMDTGDVLAVHRIPILPGDDAGSLTERLGQVAAEVTRVELPRLLRGELERTPQAHSLATHAPPITREDTFLDFSRQDARSLVGKVRAFSPRPGATAELRREGEKAKRVRILRAAVEGDGPPRGQVEVRKEGIFVGTRAGALRIDEAQIEGKKALSAQDLANGRVLRSGDVLASPAPTPGDRSR